MDNVQLNDKMQTTLTYVGKEKTPVLVIDNLVTSPETLIDIACDTNAEKGKYQQDANNFYPGIRKNVPSQYINMVKQLFPLLSKSFEIEKASQANVIMSAFSITTLAPRKLRPIQMLPHFDTPADNQLAMVHYFCSKEHGGTSIYRHNKSGFEKITTDRLLDYRLQIKKQAIAEKLHENPKYINGSSCLFTRVHSVEAKLNRAVIYPSNVLHSGNIQADLGLSNDPKKGRLTISSFIQLA